LGLRAGRCSPEVAARGGAHWPDVDVAEGAVERRIVELKRPARNTATGRSSLAGCPDHRTDGEGGRH
jgi:hypothetical protein